MKRKIKTGAAELIAVIIVLVLAGVFAVAMMQRKTQEAEALNKVVQSQIGTIEI